MSIGFSAQSDNGELGYYCDFNALDSLSNNILLSEELKIDIMKLKEFWSENNTCKKIRDSYPEELKKALSIEDYISERAVAYPLYRISGSLLDYGKFLDNGVAGLKRILGSFSSRSN